MSAIDNYIAAATEAGFEIKKAEYYLVVQTPSRYFLIVEDTSGEADCLLGVFENNDYWGTPLKQGTLQECLFALSFQRTNV